MKRAITFSLFFSLLSLFSGCGSLNGQNGRNGTSPALLGSSGTNVNAVLGFSPATGYVNAFPTQVSVSFASASLDASAAALSTYTIACGGTAYPALAVNVVPGSSVVVVSLPTITSSTGAVCTFYVAGALKDGFGNFVTGVHSAVYTLGTAPATLTASVGTAAGVPFQDTGGTGQFLQGLLLNGSQYVDGAVGAWSPFNSTSVAYGLPHGSTGAGYTQLACPAGYRVTGIYGRAGANVDAVGLVCKTADQAQTYTGPVFGGAGGVAFTLSCPAGQFATDLAGTAETYVNSLSLGCR